MLAVISGEFRTVAALRGLKGANLGVPQNRSFKMTRTVLRLCRPSSAVKIECLETDFANDLSIDEVAIQAQVSRSHFALTFRCTQNKDRKDCQKPSFLYEQT
jgi:hypothetical protein